MKVIEKLAAAKSGDDDKCEDGIAVGTHFAAVVDGVTDKTGLRFDGMAGGRFAMLAIVDALSGLDARIGEKASAEEVFTQLTAIVANRLPPGLDQYQRPGAAVTIYSAPRRELWQVGDVAFWHAGLGAAAATQRHKRVDAIAIAMRVAILRAELLAGADPGEPAVHDVGRAAILPLLERQTRFGNNLAAGEYAYGVLDGRPIPPELITVVPVPEDVDELVIASDGYPRILPTLAQTEDHLNELLAEDPLCIGPLAGTKGVQPGHVSFDDRSYLRIAL